MNLTVWKEKFVQKIGSNNISVFMVTRKEKWEKIKKLIEIIPFPCLYLDPTKESTYPYIYKMEELNEKAYGKKMSAPIWTYSNFGTIGAGITGGFLIDNKLVSKFNVVGDAVDPDISHEWTLLTDPEYQEKGIGTATLALAMQVCSLKKFHTFITQTDNPSNLIYLKNSYPLKVLAYGFVHTKPNSLFVKTKIPKNAFEVFIEKKNKMKYVCDIKVTNIPDNGIFALNVDDHKLFMELNKVIQAGFDCYLLDWIKDGKNYLVLEIKKQCL